MICFVSFIKLKLSYFFALGGTKDPYSILVTIGNFKDKLASICVRLIYTFSFNTLFCVWLFQSGTSLK